MSNNKGLLLKNRFHELLLILSFSLLIFISLFSFSAYIYLHEQRSQLEYDTGVIKTDFTAMINMAKGFVATLASIHQASDDFESSRLSLLTQQLFKQYQYLDCILYQNWIYDFNLVNFEQSLQNDGWPDFSVHTITQQKLLAQPLFARKGYMPIRFIEPLTPENAHLIGLDVLTLPLFKEKVKIALESANISAFKFKNSIFKKNISLALFQATYYGYVIPESKQEKRKQFDGFYMLFIKLDKVIKTLSEKLKAYQLSYIDDKKGETNSLSFERFNRVTFSNNLYFPDLEFGINIKKTIPISVLFSSNRLLLHVSITILILVVFLYWRRQGFTTNELHQVKLEIEQERVQAKSTLKAMSDAVIVVNDKGIVQLLNPSAEKLINRSNHDYIGQYLNEVLILFQDNQQIKLDTYEFLSEYLLQSEPLNLRLNVPESDVIVSLKVTEINCLRGDPGIVIVFRDVSIEYQLTNKLTFQVNHDDLTGLYNRVAFEDQIKITLESTHFNHITHSALYLDLDRFKLVNDTSGHAAGDKLLKVISGILHSELREVDFLARLGGDEFGIILWNLSYDSALNMAQKILASVQEFRFEWEEKFFDIGISIGLAMIDTDMKNLKDVMVAIDLACLNAKEAGRNNIYVYERDDLLLNRQQEEMNWLPRINEALELDSYELFYETIIPAESNADLPQLREILIRMRDEEGNLILPSLFIPAAERYDLMKKLDHWVIQNTLEFLSRENDPFDGRYTINLSGQSLTDLALPGYVELLLSKYFLNPERLCFEITETTAITNLNTAKIFIERMQSIGCGILLDDFGSGLSSFGYLKALPIDYIKIDGQFVNNIADDEVDDAMVRMIQEIAQIMNVKTIAEYVEDERTLNRLKNIGVDYVQGFLISKPEPLK